MTIVPAIVDTSALVALLRTREPQHASVANAISTERGLLVLPLMVVVEAGQLIERRLGAGAEATWLSRLVSGRWVIEPSPVADLARAAELIARYHDADLGLVDATIVAMAERLGVGRLYTLDRRDFSIIRPRHVAAFEILP